MPPFVPLADGAQVQVVFALGPLIVSDRLFFVSRQPPVDPTQLLALAAGVADWHVAEVMPLLSDAIQLAAVEAFDWTADPSPTIAVVAPLVNGANTSGCHSANVSIRVRFKPSTALPRTYNANFVPGIPLDAVLRNTVDPTYAESLRSAYVDLIDLAAVFGPFPAWRWVCTSQILDGAPRSEQAFGRTDFITVPSPYVNPRRRRISRLRRLPP